MQNKNNIAEMVISAIVLIGFLAILTYAAINLI